MQKGTLDQRVTADGTTVAADIHSIFIELSQEVETVYAEVGDYVQEGDLLVTYDISDTKKELEDRLKEAKITLENAQLSLEDITTPATGTELLDLELQVTNAQKAYDDAQKEAENNAALLEAGAVTQSDMMILWRLWKTPE